MIPTTGQLGEYLEGLAKIGETVCYTDVEAHFHIVKTKYEWKENPLYELYHKICQEDMLAERPLRTSVIVSKEKKVHIIPVPNDGYFKTLCKYRELQMPTTKDEKRRLHRDELEKLKTYYKFPGGIETGSSILIQPDS